ncbi:phenylalanyl-tRNA synthetase beta subunit [Halanaerobium saccharolyticum]|uniref:Phenylalanine--tRNA ligase beta subunit n=1 Tax=Halanaerobium saccharolyticum TaxID=43595 RepID=A0A4R7Z1C0_9FIRM|nr:phenylalanyl-tRNA synthetase beta subunit [Halanaerobium saccharolyticum]TDW01321.1 phenylalanyl-tRNA synthetase beta subunit [Halanaerobium saccharolyticum]TDX52789.1 phenylalanyl-tRNA synthetase beta subunit [Halanaerobium saccharolyticum]
MQISYNWLKKYIDINFTPDDLSEKLTMAGLEVEGVEYLGEGLDDIIIARIEEIKEHPDADKLVICLVKTGSDKELIPVVTGAPNVEVGQMVPFAKVGSTLPGGMKIEEVKLRGELSQGMICSKDELGLQEERAEGIMVLDDDAPLGGSFLKYKRLDDYVFKLDLTPNYARCLGMIGVAREIKSLYAQEKTLNTPPISFEEAEELGNINDYAQVEIEDPDLCPRYTARLVKNVKIKESPEWIQRRLKAAGIRPINNVVDISNFVLMEYNQPLHTFDFNKIKDGKIIVRRADAEEKMLTLDEEERVLDDEMLVISDPEKAVAVGGVMGGANTEVTEETTDVLIESAYFNPVSIRKTAKKLGMHSDSSHRFERGVDIEKVIEANNRACQMLAKCDGARVVPGVIDNYPLKYEPAVITLAAKRVNELLGINLEAAEVKESLERLGFEVEPTANADEFEVTVPSYRTDVEQGADLVEEIARVYGYNRIPSTRPTSKQRGKRSSKQKFEARVKKLLQAGGLDEVITYSLQDKKSYQDLNLTQFEDYAKFVSIKNPLSEAFGILRTTLLPGIIDVLSSNARRQGSEMAVFETGTVFRNRGGSNRPEELNKLGGGIFGQSNNLWQQGAPNFFALKGVLEMLFDRVQLEKYSFIADNDNRDFLHPGRRAEIKYDQTQTFGFIGEIHPELADQNNLPAGTTVFELDLDFLFEITAEKSYQYHKLVKYPVLARDLAIVMAEDVAVGDIHQAIREKGGSMLKGLELFDIYQGDQIEAGYQSAAFELKFQAEDRTLTDQEVNERFNQIVNHLKEEYSAEIRGN